MRCLGIESSCDDTALSCLSAEICSEERPILSELHFNHVHTQSIHNDYGGVVPELASRGHLHVLPSLFRDYMQIDNFDFIAVTSSPGLIGGLIVGVMFAKGLSLSTGKPIIPVNHLEAHALSARINFNELKFPFLLLLISGGHCYISLVHGVGHSFQLGATLDDSLGETYDKVARMLGLKYPGGPEIERCSLNGRSGRFILPTPLYKKDGCDFSFSGLKTAVKTLISKNFGNKKLSYQDVCDISLSFEKSVSCVIVDRLSHAIDKVFDSTKTLVVAGGVASNQKIRSIIEDLCKNKGICSYFPPKHLCTDNAAMVAWCGVEYFYKYKNIAFKDLSFSPSSRQSI